jgi:hypothetical protein
MQEWLAGFGTNAGQMQFMHMAFRELIKNKTRA